MYVAKDLKTVRQEPCLEEFESIVINLVGSLGLLTFRPLELKNQQDHKKLSFAGPYGKCY